MIPVYILLQRLEEEDNHQVLDEWILRNYNVFL